MSPITIIFNSNRSSYDESTLIPSEFDIWSYTGSPKSLQLNLNDVDLQSIHLFIQQHPSHFIMGYLSYDIGRNLMQKNISKNQPITTLPAVFLVAVEPEKISKENFTNSKPPFDSSNTKAIQLQSLVTKKEYIEQVSGIKQHIQQGNIYELNYCIPFVAENVDLHPRDIWDKLNALSPMPFSSFIDQEEFSVISASPERFIRKKQDQVFIQPMKGTKARGKNKEEDALFGEALKNDPKERSENVMIVDLTRNDLSKIAIKGSVKVEELFGVYQFPTIHQMISTVSCQVEKNLSFTDILPAVFPMGSMTGAPKSKAVDLIDEFEQFSRGPFSGMMGYINPTGDFDFNVLIRTIFYDKRQKKIFVAVGSAITSQSDVEKEYQECLIKLQPLLNALNATIK